MVWLTLTCVGLILAGCEDDPTGPEGIGLDFGVYVAGPSGSGAIGSFEVDTEMTTTDMLEAGAAIELDLQPDGVLGGRLFVPPGAGGLARRDIVFNGTWRVRNGQIELRPDVGSFLEDIAFGVEGGRVVTGETAAGRTFRISMERVAAEDPSLPSSAGTSLQLEGELDLDPLAGVLEVTNPTQSSIALGVGPCSVLLRAEATDGPVFDQLDLAACEGPFEVRVIAAGAMLELRTPPTGSCEVTGGGRPDDAEYAFTLYTRFGSNDAELDVGAVTLTCQR